MIRNMVADEARNIFGPGINPWKVDVTVRSNPLKVPRRGPCGGQRDSIKTAPLLFHPAAPPLQHNTIDVCPFVSAQRREEFKSGISRFHSRAYRE